MVSPLASLHVFAICAWVYVNVANSARVVVQVANSMRLQNQQHDTGKISNSSEAKQTNVELSQIQLGSFCEENGTKFEYYGVSGPCSLECGPSSYSGPVDGLGHGLDGVTVTMFREDATKAKVVAKLFRGNKTKENLKHECGILKTLERLGVKGVLTCAGSCEHNGTPMIIVEPFLEDRTFFLHGIDEKYFTTPQTARKSLVSMMKTAMGMLSAGIANEDQGHNMLWSKDGQVTFIDMGKAVDLRTVHNHKKCSENKDKDNDEAEDEAIKCAIEKHVNAFIDTMLKKFPERYWKNGDLGKTDVSNVMREAGLPVTPSDVNSRFKTTSFKNRRGKLIETKVDFEKQLRSRIMATWFQKNEDDDDFQDD